MEHLYLMLMLILIKIAILSLYAKKYYSLLRLQKSLSFPLFA